MFGGERRQGIAAATGFTGPPRYFILGLRAAAHRYYDQVCSRIHVKTGRVLIYIILRQ
jgi:hypothetical protein